MKGKVCWQLAGGWTVAVYPLPILGELHCLQQRYLLSPNRRHAWLMQPRLEANERMYFAFDMN